MTAAPPLPEILLALFEKSSEGILVVGGDRRILAASASARRGLGDPPGGLVGRRVVDFVTDDGADERWARIQRGETVRSEVVTTRSDGSSFAIEFVTTPHVLPDVHVTVFRDISERRQRELQSERYELLSKQTNDIVLFVDEQGNIVEANEAAGRAYGYTRAELVGTSVRELRAPHTLGDYADLLERAFRSPLLFETEHRRKDGTTFPVEVGSRSALIGGRRMLVAMVRDITERRAIQARLVQADRLGAFGMIAAGVAHEVNNPLAYALNNLEMLARRVPRLEERVRDEATRDPSGLLMEMSEIRQMVETAREGMDRVRRITRDLKTFSRGDSEEFEGVDVRHVLESAVNLAHGDIRHRAELVRDYGDVRPLRGKASRLGQVFLNLLLNAAQSIPADRVTRAVIRVATRMEGDDVVVEVSDDGVGIPERVRDRVFEPFVTSKAEGTGLGLYIARATVEEHGGTIRILPRPEGGTTVVVALPTPQLAGDAALPRSVSASPAAAPDPRWRVLIVDDEPTLGATLRGVLGNVRDVSVVASGEAALGEIAGIEGQGPQRFDVILCDVMMPTMSGKELYERVLARWPALASRFIFMTGGATTPELQDFLRSTHVPCLAKPFTADELARAMRRTVSRS